MRLHVHRAVGAGSLALVAACSTVAPPKSPVACETDDDCDVAAGEVCAIDQGRCVPGTDVPPLADLAFDVREPAEVAGEAYAFRTEILGCDAAVELVSTGDRQVTVRRSEAAQFWSLLVTDPLADDPNTPPAGTVEIRSPSRIGLRDLVRQAVVEPSDEGPRTPFLDWPYHHPSDAGTVGPFGTERALARIVPGPDEPPYERWIAPAAARTDRACASDEDCCPSPPCSPRVPPVCLVLGETAEQACSHAAGTTWLYEASPVRACQRTLAGTVRRIGPGGPAASVESATVTLSHAAPEPPADPEGIPSLGPPPPEQVCTSDADCVSGLEICDIATGTLAGRCTHPLEGRPAGNGSFVTDDAGAFSASVYTYCEADPSSAIQRRFAVTVVPPSFAAAPTVQHLVTADFPPPASEPFPPGSLDAPLCVPDWSPAITVVVTVDGAPVMLGAFADDTPITCCEVGCLFGAAEDGPQPTAPDRCAPVTASGSARAVASAPFPAPPTSQWEDLGCASLDRSDPFPGQFRRVGACDEDGRCTLEALPGAAPVQTLTLRVESPVGSVLGSMTTTLPVPPPPEPPTITLPRRVLVRGTVRLGAELCDDAKPGDCNDVDATIVAERLRMPGESETTVPGPYLHTVPTFTDPRTGEGGAYVLPLDPGVWLVTALPQAGSRGDPAPIQILDLRDGRDRTHDIVMPLGIRVTVELRGFDPRTTLSPWDLGSWRNLDHPGRDGPVRLSDPGECLSSVPDLACQIRALTPGGTGLLPSITSTVQVTARKADHPATCG